jgi:hypothetical protein
MGSILGIKNRSPLTYERSLGMGGSGPFSDVPLKRLRWIDAYTTVAPAMQNGAPGTPYQSPEAWLNTLGAPTSTDDASTAELGVISPAAADAWSPNPQTWTVPSSRNVILMAFNMVAPSFAPLTINWNNAPAAFVPTIATFIVENANISGLTMTITDAAGSAPSALIFGSSNLQGTLDVTGAALFEILDISGTQAQLQVTSSATPTWSLTLQEGSQWSSTNLTCAGLQAEDSIVSDSGTITTSGNQNYTRASIGAPGLTAGAQCFFNQTSWSQACVLSAPTAEFDGISWKAFQDADCTYGSTIVAVTGGFLAGQVPGANITESVTVSIIGTGASSGYEQGGNWYTIPTLAEGVTTITVADTADPGDTICFTRTDNTEGAELQILDAGSGTIITLTGPGSVVVYFESGHWVLQIFGQSSDGGGAVPLARFRWIDGNTLVPAAFQNGTESAPYSSPEAWLATLGDPTSADDAATFEVGSIAPTAADVWDPDPQTWTIPPCRSIQITSTNFPAAPTFTGPVMMTGLTVNWANGVTAFIPSQALLVFEALAINEMAMTVTDGPGSCQSALLLKDGELLNSTLNVSGATNFSALLVENNDTQLVVTSGASPTWKLGLSNDVNWVSTNLSCGSVQAVSGCSVLDTVAITTTTTQTYDDCQIDSPSLVATQFTFYRTRFEEATALSGAPGTVATFDGQSWLTFIAQGGSYSANVVVVVVGGYLAGPVPGAAINNPAGGAVSLSITGAGATAGYTQGGNWYTVKSLAVNTTITLLDSGPAAQTLRITRTDDSGNTLTVLDAGTGALASIPAGGGATLYYTGTAWVLQ